MNVAAADKVTTFTIGGGLGAGFVGVAGGIDIGIADITSQAYIGSFATLHAAKDVAFHALAIKNIQTYAVSIGGGFVGVAGSVSVWSVGTAPTGSYNEGSYGQDRGTWSSTATYAQGDVVTGSDGKRYGAKVANPTLDPVADTTGSQWEGSTNALSPSSGKPDAATEAGGHANGSGTGGYTGILDGTSNMHNTSDNTNGRMQPTLGSANTSVHGSAPSSNIVSAEFSNASVPQGTVATVGAGTVIVAGGSVSVDAGENLSVNGLAGTAAGGAVAVGGSVLILGITSNVEAFIQEGASVTAGGNVNVKAVLTESDNGIVFAGVGGVVAVTGQVVLITSHATQNAHIDDGAVIPTAGGTVDVEAIGTRTVSPLAIGGSIGLVAAGASVAVALVDGDTTATIGNVTIGSLAPAGGIVEVARSTIVVPVQAYSVSVGVGGGISGAVAVAAISGTTTALYNGHATLSGGASITANGTNTPTASTLSVATGAFAAGINVASATTSRTVFARFTSGANVAAGGAVIVGATSRNHASATTPSVTVSPHRLQPAAADRDDLRCHRIPPRRRRLRIRVDRGHRQRPEPGDRDSLRRRHHPRRRRPGHQRSRDGRPERRRARQCRPDREPPELRCGAGHGDDRLGRHARQLRFGNRHQRRRRTHQRRTRSSRARSSPEPRPPNCARPCSPPDP